MQTPAAGQAKRRRRTQDDLDECKEKLPLEDDGLLARLVMQQRAALQDYRGQLDRLRQQQQQQQQQVAEAERYAAAIADAWAALNTDLLLLLSQQQHTPDPALESSVQALLTQPGICLFDCASPEGSSPPCGTASWRNNKKEGGSNSVRAEKTESASSDDEDDAFHSLVKRDGRSSSPASSGSSSSSSHTDSEMKQLKHRLLACRKWSIELVQRLVLQLVSNSGASDSLRREKTVHKEASAKQTISNDFSGSSDAAGGTVTAYNTNSDTTTKAATAEASPRAASEADVETSPTAAAAVPETPAAAAVVAATAAGICPKCLALQSALRRMRLRAGSWRARARVAEQQQQQAATAAAAADLEISRLKKQQVMLRAAAGAPAATALLAAALRGEEIKRETGTAHPEDAQQQQQPATADAAAPAPKGSSLSSPAAGEAESEEQQQQQHQQHATNSDDDADADAAVLQARLQQKEKQLQEMIEEQTKLRKIADDAAALPTLRRVQIMKSPPFIELQQLCAQRDAALAAKSAEVDELRRELLAEQSKADAAFEELAKKQTEAREQLAERISAVLEENQTLKAKKEEALREIEAVKKQLEASQQLRQELETASAQRALQLTQMRMQFDQLKNASHQVLVRNERLKTEKQRVIEALRTSEVNRLRLAESLRSGEASAATADAVAAGETPTVITAAAATGAPPTVREATVKGEETQPADKASTASLASEAEGQLLRIELETMQRRLNEQQELEAEVLELRQQYSRVTDELEEVSKAFEERQTHCEHLLRQLKARDDMLLQQKAAADAAVQQQVLLQRIGRLQEQKIQLEKQQVDQLTASGRAFSEALRQAQDRATVADQQRDEIASCLQAVRAEREKLFKDNDEMAREVQLLIETNKASESCLEQHQAKVQSLEASLRRQTEARAEADKRLEKLKEKQEKQERKRLLAAAEDPSLAINHLLQEENDTMRRRLLCGVCNERFKDQMLVKCGHMFCQECIEKNVKARNRKCPHCKTQFDQKDTRKAYLHN